MLIVCLGHGMCDGRKENGFEQLIFRVWKAKKEKENNKVIDSRWVYKQA